MCTTGTVLHEHRVSIRASSRSVLCVCVRTYACICLRLFLWVEASVPLFLQPHATLVSTLFPACGEASPFQTPPATKQTVPARWDVTYHSASSISHCICTHNTLILLTYCIYICTYWSVPTHTHIAYSTYRTDYT